MKNKVEYILFLVVYRFFTLFPIKTGRKFALLIAAVFYNFVPIRKEVARKNIKIAFPEKSEKEITKILKQSYINFSTVLIEIFYLKKYKSNDVKEMLEIEEFDKVYGILSAGNGLLMLSAHFGNWELGAIAANCLMNLPTSIIVKRIRNPYVDEFINEIRTRWGNKLMLLGNSPRELMLELKNKKIVALLADQRAPEEAEKYELFGKETAVFTGPAYLSVKMNVPICCIFVHRLSDGNYSAILENIEYDKTADEKDKIKQITTGYLKILEKNIKKYPDHWLWFHDRWKH